MFVAVGPLNPYILTRGSGARYDEVLEDIERWLVENNIPYFLVQELPSPYYADASHPLSVGYLHIAEQLFASESFQRWMSGAKGIHEE